MTAPKVLILMATYNGERFLEEQLASIAAQTVATIDLLVSDDGSTDATMAILRDWQQRWRKGKFDIIAGPRTGFADNFRHLILNAPEGADYVGFSDQDDVWDADKVEAAIAVLSKLPADKPALYGSRTRLIDANGKHIGYSPLFRFQPGFRNALVQSYAGGNTMLLNRAGLSLLRESAHRTSFLMHDWWSYLIVSGAEGGVFYDPTPHTRYRQHGKNAVGGAVGILGRPRRLLALLRGQFARWSDANVRSLLCCQDLLSEACRHAVAQFEELRRAPLPTVPSRLLRAGLYRQTARGNLAMSVAALLHRL